MTATSSLTARQVALLPSYMVRNQYPTTVEYHQSEAAKLPEGDRFRLMHERAAGDERTPTEDEAAEMIRIAQRIGQPSYASRCRAYAARKHATP